MIRLIYVVFPLLFLSACTLPMVEDDVVPIKTTWAEHQKQLQQLRVWSLNGRVSVHTEDEAWNGSLLWKQSGDQYDLRILAPLGAGSLQLQGSPEGVVLRQSGQENALFAKDPVRLLQQQYGWYIPVHSLRYWVIGMPDPTLIQAASLKLDDYGRLQEMQQAGWKIRFLRYLTIGGIQLPGKVFMEQNDLGVRMLIQQWDLEG